MNRFYCFGLLLMMCICDASRASMPSQKLKVDNTISSTNKKPLKSIKSQDGDIIDCIHISHQPAFDHPSLKNHTIQMRPNHYPKELFGEDAKKSNFAHYSKHDNTKPILQLWHLNGRCPRGTIPIRRPKPEEIKRASSNNSFGKKQPKSFPLLPLDDDTERNIRERSIAWVGWDQYYGAKATVSVWNPQIQDRKEFSSSQIWIVEDTDSGVNTIQAGWTVYPYLFGDNNARLFVSWTSDNDESAGCYNLLCSGFVQTSKNLVLGGSINPISTYRGSQSEFTVLVWKDPEKDLWWLMFGSEVIGYWPSSLIQYPVDDDILVAWGGEVLNVKVDGQHTTTQMGSGHFAEEGFKGASYFRNLQVVDGSNTLSSPSDTWAMAGRPNCYNILLKNNNDWGDYFFYGGPGRNPKCP